VATDHDTPHDTPLKAPKYWPSWAALGLLHSTVWLPHGFRMTLGAALGRLYLRMGERRRRIAETNLGLCFPELSAEERDRLLQQHFESLGKGLMELAMAWWASDRRCLKGARIEGREHLSRALHTGRGVILFSAHFTTLELGGRLLNLLYPELPFHGMYRPNENPVLDRVMHRQRSRRILHPIPRDDVRTMLRSLKKGEVVWYASDQNYGHKNSVFAGFFGIPAATNTAVSRLAKRGDAVLLPFFPYRLADDSGYVIEISAPLEGFPSADPRQDAIRLNRIIEGWARRAPAQYFWIHRRFKDRPEGEEGFY